MAMKVGIQLYSVRDEMKKDPVNAIRQVAEIGYKNLEFASSCADTDPGVGFGVDADTMVKLLDETGAKMVAATSARSTRTRSTRSSHTTPRSAQSTSASPPISTRATIT